MEICFLVFSPVYHSFVRKSEIDGIKSFLVTLFCVEVGMLRSSDSPLVPKV